MINNISSRVVYMKAWQGEKGSIVRTFISIEKNFQKSRASCRWQVCCAKIKKYGYRRFVIRRGSKQKDLKEQDQALLLVTILVHLKGFNSFFPTCIAKFDLCLC
mmetsp:Transcript_31272/g.71517  ORF Transcript_31272/g.71517 Transcript_31272/m.71517 type:complete len:104 (+) Transcript_31272:2107-2418(+)